MEKTLNQIRQDLRLLKKIQHSIQVLLDVESIHKKRLEVLLSKQQTESVKADITKIQDIISKLDIENYIKRATEIESKYWEAINSLPPLDKTIILDGYINGTPYWKLGNKLNYSEDAIKKRIPKIIENIAESIREK